MDLTDLAVEAASAAPVPHDYEQALRKSLLYFEAERYYDAGDHVKFGLSMAITVTMLSWSLLEYDGDVAAAGELAHALESIKWGTDYFIKANTKPDELSVEAPSLEYLLE
ncbi:hypothetical protein ZWY2020_058123 [Hordeum vulgare]|nr:hypothetical protein ZWY2020_058123 [Hordeum vulgare]